MKVWGFFYNSCTWESAAGLESLHTSKEGAEKAMAWHKEGKSKEREKIYEDEPDDSAAMKEWNKKMRETENDGMQAWFVQEIEVQNN